MVEKKQETFDAVLASFALHHLTLEEKNDVIGWFYRTINAKGVVMLIDIVRPEEEDRAAYIGRYLADVRQRWSSLMAD